MVDSLYFARSLSEVLLDADSVFEKSIPKDLDPIFSVLLGLDPKDRVKCQKHWCSWPMARWTRSEADWPSFLQRDGFTESFQLPLRGRTRAHMRNLLASRETSRRAARVFVSILQGCKRGCAPVTSDFQVEACRKHKAALTNPIEPDHLDDFRSKFDQLWMENLDSGRSFSGWSPIRRCRHWYRQLRNPSFHASWEARRSEGGRAAVIRDFLRNQAGSSDLDLEPHLLYMKETRPGHVTEVRGFPLPSYCTALREAVQGMNGPLQAKVELVIEPLKCRVITKGESLPYWVSQTWQRQAWRVLQETPAFALTGRTIDGSDVAGLERKTLAQGLTNFDHWVSGDYSAATDGLSLAINQTCVDSLVDSLSGTEQERRLCRSVLGSHIVHYPDRLRTPGDDLGDFPMKNGQLMGSPLSFPVLCAVNLAAYWCALEEYTGRSWKREDLPCLVNGDDILFKSSLEFYEVWKIWTRRAGFELSLGKNYISKHFLTVNSEAWLTPKLGTFHHVGFLNCGLLLQEAGGPRRVPLRAETAERPLIPKLQWILDNCHNPSRAYRRILHYWKKSIDIWTHHGFYGLTVPVELGGCGLRVPQDRFTPNLYFTKGQQLIAGHLHDFFSKLDVEGTEVPRQNLIRVSLVDRPWAQPAPSKKYHSRIRFIDRTTPCFEGTYRESDPELHYDRRRPLLNCQSTEIEVARPTFRIRSPGKRALFRALKSAKKIKKPSYFALEPRWTPALGGQLMSPPLVKDQNVDEMATDIVPPPPPPGLERLSSRPGFGMGHLGTGSTGPRLIHC